MIDLLRDPAFAARPAPPRSADEECRALHQLVGALAISAEQSLILQMFTDLCLSLLRAGSVGLCLQERDSQDRPALRWVALSGALYSLLNTVMPREGSICGACLDRGVPQLLGFYDVSAIAGDQAPPIQEGMLIPWYMERMSGVLWVVRHSPGDPFNPEDYRLMQRLSDFIGVFWRHLRRGEFSREQAGLAARDGFSNDLAHELNSPLQAAINALYLSSRNPEQSAAYLSSAIGNILRVSVAVDHLLAKNRPRKAG